jgi:acyl carrier protein
MSNRTPAEILTELQPIFEEVLDEPNLKVALNSSALNTPNWDSLAHIDIIEMTERHFKVKFGLSELQRLKEVADLVALVLEKQQTA